MKPADVVNNALARIGHRARIGSFFEGSPEALAARDCWEITLDEVLAREPWIFARQIITLVQSDAGSQPYGWGFRYTRPAVVKVLDVYPVVADLFDPPPSTWMEFNGSVHLILTNFGDARAACTGRPRDPVRWSAEFTEQMIDTLGERLRARLEADDETRGRSEQRPGRDRAPNEDRQSA